MNINNNYNTINFGQKIPTSSFLKIGSGIFNFEDAKNLCQTFDKKCPGHISYYKRAQQHAENIGQKNPHLKNILTNISHLIENNKKLQEINRLTKELGEEIDVVI